MVDIANPVDTTFIMSKIEAVGPIKSDPRGPSHFYSVWAGGHEHVCSFPTEQRAANSRQALIQAISDLKPGA